MLDLSDIDVDALTSKLYSTSKIDLRNYAKSSLKRRFIRISEMQSLRTTDELFTYVSNLSDATQFVNAITVNTTEMFRDPSFWRVLRNEILPKLASKEHISVLHAGCSTGEEVISMQILLDELGLRQKTKSIACDINSSVLSVAAQAMYKHKNFDLSENNYLKAGGQKSLKNYLNSDHEGVFAFRPTLLSQVEFLKFDLVQDTFQNKFDLILCRNVLIYFEFGLQEKVITGFLSQLNAEGYLCIGQQETIINSNLLQYLRIVNEQEKIYRLI